MNVFPILTVLFIIVSVAMVLIILVQRPSGGGLAGAFGGAGGGGTDTVFGGRVGDALTWATIVAFVLYLLLAVSLNRVDIAPTATAAAPARALVEGEAPAGAPAEGETGDAGTATEPGAGETTGEDNPDSTPGEEN